MRYQLSATAIKLPPEKLWLKICGSLVDKEHLTSLTGKIYQLADVSYDEIIYSSETRNKGEQERLSREDVISFLEILKEAKSFSTSSVKDLLPSSVYRKRSPLFAIVKTLGFIDPVQGDL